MSVAWIEPDWPAPASVRSAATLRAGGASEGVYAGLNIGDHVGDNPAHVAANRRMLREALQLPAEPLWLSQVHDAGVVWADAPESLSADAAVTLESGVVCVVMTADCLPILLCDRAGSRVAAVHAGWRGLACGVVEAAVLAMGGADLMAWMGPAIGPDAFEVGSEVRAAFLDRLIACKAAFRQSGDAHYRADLYQLARIVLEGVGVRQIYGGKYCTYSDPDRFFSYRRDGQTGRMATLIWRE